MAARKARRWPATKFSRFVRQRRLDLDKTQADVAAALNLNQSYISQMERGRPPSQNVSSIKAYADVLEVSADVLWDLLGVSAANRYSASVSDLKPTVQGLARLTEDLSIDQIRLLEVLAREMDAANKRVEADAPPRNSAAIAAQANGVDRGR